MRCLLALIVGALSISTAYAQFNVELGFNVCRQPIWGPTGYDHVEYYYLPDIDVYYNVPLEKYFYDSGGRWVSGSSLPSRCEGFDLYHCYKVVINERMPYRNAQKYRDQYATSKGRQGQQPIRDSRDEKYFANKNHPEHENWVKQQAQKKGAGRAYGNSNVSGTGTAMSRDKNN